MSLIPRSRGGTLARFAIGAVIVIAFTATTTAVAGLLQFKQLANDISRGKAISHARVKIPQPGEPQTILVLGSDHRAHHSTRDARSDTIMLVRLDGGSSTINVISIPRDLRVSIPGGGIQKVNAAYSLGGPNLVVKTLQQNVFPRLQVNHIVDINFAGFMALVDQIGCVYTDVDRRYYNQNIGTAATNYSSIDLHPGYQKLCDQEALSYVRYRHTDTDIVRAARQQDFVRDAKDQYGQTRLIENRDTLLRIFGEHTQTDPNLHSAIGIENLFNLVAFADGHAIKEVHFPAILQPCTKSSCYVTATTEAEAHAFAEFMAPTVAKPAAKKVGGPHPPGPRAAVPTDGLSPDLPGGRTQAAALGNPGLRVYFPRLIAAGSSYESPRPGWYPNSYVIPDPQHHHYAAYRIVLGRSAGQYYGIQGTTWRKAPILDRPSEIRVVGGRKLELHYDGQKLRLVAWRTAHAVYWVSNTLSLDLTEPQMIGIAASLVRVGAGA